MDGSPERPTKEKSSRDLSNIKRNITQLGFLEKVYRTLKT